MFADQLNTYRNLITLKDGARVLLRPLIRDDRQRFLDMFAPVSAEDLKHMRTPVTPQLANRWIDELDYQHILPIVAVFQDRLVGDATLHFHPGPSRHIGDVRLFIVAEFRQRKLGTHMLRALIDLGHKAGLHWLTAEVVADQTKVIKAFQNVGFQPKCTFEDAYMFPDGTTTDKVVLLMRLIPREEEF
jgi:RimJ/RimL family protein N-acetyltransferase